MNNVKNTSVKEIGDIDAKIGHNRGKPPNCMWTHSLDKGVLNTFPRIERKCVKYYTTYYKENMLLAKFLNGIDVM